MFSYVAVNPLIIVTIADTKKTRDKTTILAELNNSCVIGTHLIENGHYLFRGNIWLDNDKCPQYDQFENILDRMIIEASKGSCKVHT